jgi:tRNA A-37 threonylcarbamoyl transferase component Bud32
LGKTLKDRKTYGLHWKKLFLHACLDDNANWEVSMSESRVYIDAREPETRTDQRLMERGQFEKGGMSLIVDAVDANLMRTIAMKVMRKENNKDEHELNRMVVEAQITAQLDHPNIVPVYELGIDRKNRLFFTMKKICGKPLYELINGHDLSFRIENYLFRMIQIMLKVCDAVSYAHSKGVLHRDLKPDNIMVGEFGQVYLMDWGIARVKESVRSSAVNLGIPNLKKRKRYSAKEEKPGAVVGTPCYMSPEQASGDVNAINELSDVFSLGAILYEILTCTPPILGNSLREMIMRAKKCEIQPPDERVDFPLPVGLVRIIMKALSKDPAERYSSVVQLRNALERFLEGGWHFQERTYKPGELIVCEGDRGNEAYMIRTGQCRVFKIANGEKIEMRIMGRGDLFGETAVFTDESRSASVEAVDEVTVAVVTKRHFEEELGLGAWVGGFIHTLAERFREADQRASRFEELLRQKSP